MSIKTPIHRELLALHMVIETLGIPADDIFVSHGKFDESSFAVQVVIKREDKQFVIDVAEVKEDAETFKTAWLAAVDQYNALPREERSKILANSKTRAQAADLIAAIVSKGFVGQGTN